MHCSTKSAMLSMLVVPHRCRHVRRVVVADLHRVDQAVDDRVQVDPGVEIGDHRHGVRGERCRRSAAGPKYLASLGRSLVIGTCRALPAQRREHVIGAVPGRDDQRPREELAAVRADDVGAAVGPRSPSSRRPRRSRTPRSVGPARQRTPHGRQVDDAAVDVEVRHVRVEVGEPLLQRLAVERLGLQPSRCSVSKLSCA